MAGVPINELRKPSGAGSCNGGDAVYVAASCFWLVVIENAVGRHRCLEANPPLFVLIITLSFSTSDRVSVQSSGFRVEG